MQRGAADVVGPGQVANFDEGRQDGHGPRLSVILAVQRGRRPGLGARERYGGSWGYSILPFVDLYEGGSGEFRADFQTGKWLAEQVGREVCPGRDRAVRQAVPDAGRGI